VQTTICATVNESLCLTSTKKHYLPECNEFGQGERVLPAGLPPDEMFDDDSKHGDTALWRHGDISSTWRHGDMASWRHALDGLFFLSFRSAFPYVVRSESINPKRRGNQKLTCLPLHTPISYVLDSPRHAILT